ncbi:MAG: TIGR03364 family FAD-dependent oxidoreductase [Planctomycetota bacterium]|nr:TIGR03364 family FAD-dependent oxidoreductase [Planctomycetota bacterium]
MTPRYDVAIIGAGIIGLAHAYEAARHGLRTVVYERSPRCEGASIRNFGMVWVVGQTPGENLARAKVGRETWLHLCREADLWHDASGSLHLATHEDELDVLREFAERGPGLGYDVRLLDRGAVAAISPAARRDTVLAGLYSATEVCVDSPRAIAGLARHLASRYRVEFRWNERVSRIEHPAVHSASREGAHVAEAARVLVCAGHEIEELFPGALAGTGVRRCKLQMMALEAPPPSWKLGPMIAGGLTLRHYENFAVCPSLPRVRSRIARDTPDLDRYGIHVLASQHSTGEIIVGDSHEYDADITPFDNATIDDLILAELRRLVDLPSWRVVRRWHGLYSKLPGRTVFVDEPRPGVRLVCAAGGAGMTMAFALAREWWGGIGGDTP